MNDPFSIQAFNFPKDFILGSSTAGHQIEGNNVNSDRWQLELENLGKPGWDDVSGMACNSYNLYEEDARILSELHHKAYRLSIEWARIEPVCGEFNQKEIDHYLKVLISLKSKGIKVFLTVIHFSTPLWFYKNGGFVNLNDNLKYFERFLEKVVPIFAPYVDFWNVLNEFNSGLEQDCERKFACMHYHALGYHVIKKYSSAPISSAHAFVMQAPYRAYDKFDKALADYYDVQQNEFFFHAVRTGELVIPGRDGVYNKDFKNCVDFWSVNTYLRTLVDARRPSASHLRYPHDRLQMIDKDFYLNGMDAECLIHNLSRLKDKPVYITENGCSCDNDDFRIIYILEYLSALNRCIETGVDVKGYLYWSFLDNYEWTSYKPRFGMVDVDFKGDFKRTPKNSAYFYKEIIDNNGYNPEMLVKYIKALPRVEYEWKGLK